MKSIHFLQQPYDSMLWAIWALYSMVSLNSCYLIDDAAAEISPISKYVGCSKGRLIGRVIAIDQIVIANDIDIKTVCSELRKECDVATRLVRYWVPISTCIDLEQGCLIVMLHNC